MNEKQHVVNWKSKYVYNESMSLKSLTISLIVITALIGALSLYIVDRNSNLKKVEQNVQGVSVTKTPTPLPVKETTSLFIPYWDIPENFQAEIYDRLIYFGLTAGTNGVVKGDSGYANLKNFVKAAEGRETYLTIKMLDTDTNTTILKNKSMQEKIIDDSVQLAKEQGFKGIVLDLELTVLPFNDVVENINTFVKDFYMLSKEEDVSFSLTMYGDLYFRKRPFDLKTLSENADNIYIMAYDLHKVRGLPGPNFPLEGKDKYGYDFKTMIEDFLQIVPSEKITVIFGMYGYDWLTDEQKRPMQPAKAISLVDIRKKFLSKCEWKNCVIQRDPITTETEISYVDMNSGPYAQYHSVYFEDEESVKKKKEFLKEKGIGSTSYWVYGYF